MSPHTWLHVRRIPAGEPLDAPEHPAHLREGPVDRDRWLCEDSKHRWYLLKHDPREVATP